MARFGAGTRCNLTHCGWHSSTGGLELALVDPLAWRTRLRELRVTVQPAGRKGLGVFSAQTARPGRWVCSYAGELLNLSQLLTRYATETPTYVYRLSSSFSIDARDTSHFSRYINHHAQPNLHAKVDRRSQRIDFYTIRPLRPGDEVFVDYGVSYWHQRADLLDAGTEPRLQPSTLPALLPRGAPITAAEASTALAFPTRDAGAAFLRSRGLARGLPSVHELAALPLALSSTSEPALTDRVRLLLLGLLSPSAPSANMQGGLSLARAPHPSRVGAYLLCTVLSERSRHPVYRSKGSLEVYDACRR